MRMVGAGRAGRGVGRGLDTPLVPSNSLTPLLHRLPTNRPTRSCLPCNISFLIGTQLQRLSGGGSGVR